MTRIHTTCLDQLRYLQVVCCNILSSVASSSSSSSSSTHTLHLCRQNHVFCHKFSITPWPGKNHSLRFGEFNCVQNFATQQGLRPRLYILPTQHVLFSRFTYLFCYLNSGHGGARPHPKMLHEKVEFLVIILFKGPLQYLLRPLLGKNEFAVTQHMYAFIGPNLDNIH